MIRTDTDQEFFDQRRIEFENYKETLPKEPEGDVKKEYYVGCYTDEDWNYVHEILTQDGTLEDNIPSDSCECSNECKHSPVRGIYLLTDSEAEQLRNHPKVKYVTINQTKYPGTYKINPDDLSLATKFYRYQSAVKSQRNNYNTMLVYNKSDVPVQFNNRAGYQLTRHQQQDDPWYNISNIPSPQTYEILVSDTDIESSDRFLFNGSDRNGVVYGENLNITVNTGDTLKFKFAAPLRPDYYFSIIYGINFTTGISSVNANNNILNDGTITNNSSYNDRDTVTYVTKGSPKAELIIVKGNLNYNNNVYTYTYKNISTISVNDPLAGVIFEDRIQQYGDGSDVDIIVADQDMWFGHVEFQNNLGGPTGYRGGNVLPGNGTCDLLDLVLDAPYYLDPGFFNADPSNRLTTRWDGTKVPVEFYAKNWWKFNSLLYRSSKFVSPSNGGSAVGNDDFGEIPIPDLYTREICNGSNIKMKTGNGFHGTPCASLAYGRTQGWAYNANKWFLNLYGTNGVDFVPGFDLQKVFHQIKPINPSYGTKDPTISSNSWGYSAPFSTITNVYGSGNYYFRQGTSGSGGVAFEYTTRPEFLKYFTSTIASELVDSNPELDAGNELINSGVIFVCASGNSNQKMVQSDHPDYNNYISSQPNTSYVDATFSYYGNTYYKSLSRAGFPAQIGVDRTTTPYTYKTINVGALDDQYAQSGSFVGQERAVFYTNKGNLIDVFAAADNTIAANDRKNITFGNIPYQRYDNQYTLNGQQSLKSYDYSFSGTSAACPVTVGLIATKLQYNRSWTYSDVRNWIGSSGWIPENKFYRGFSEAGSLGPNDYRWKDYNNPQGAPSFVLWDNLTLNEPDNAFEVSTPNTNPNEGQTVSIFISTNAPNGTYYYTIEPAPGSTISSSDFDSNNFLSGSFLVTNGSGTIPLAVSEDFTTEGLETFRLRIRTDGISGTIVATSDYIVISDTSISINSIIPSSTVVDEGSVITFNVTTLNPNLSTSTLYWTINHGTTNSNDFVATSGSFAVNNKSGSFSIVTNVDLLIETPEVFYVDVREDSINGNILASSPQITINDITPKLSTGNDSIRFASGNGLIFRGVIIKYT